MRNRLHRWAIIAAFLAAGIGTPLIAKDKTMFKTLDDRMLVAPQITAADIAEAKAQGVTLIINNRPDGEDPGAAQSAEIATVARAAGLDYIGIPVGQGGFALPQVEAMTIALANARGKTLAYCRSGTRSTLLWSLARAKAGEDPAVLREKAQAAGYNLAPVATLIDMLAAKK